MEEGGGGREGVGAVFKNRRWRREEGGERGWGPCLKIETVEEGGGGREGVGAVFKNRDGGGGRRGERGGEGRV